MATILIVDDDSVQRRLLEAMARRFGHDAIVADGGEAAIKALGDGSETRIDCMVLDLVMPDLDGLDVLARMREAGIAIPVIVQTDHGGIDNVISAMRAGAADFVVKPVGAERLQVSLRNALATSALETEIQRLKRSHAGQMSQAFAGELASLGRPSPPITIADAEPAIAAGALDLLDAHGDVRPLEEIENEIIRFAITHYRGQMSEIARRLRIGRSTLYRKLKELGFDGDANGEAENVASG
jgi:DNA-binding NtrC family response regulator